MSPVALPVFSIVFGVGLASMAVAAGGGGGAGGAGHQRAINSGLPAGEAGPPGSSNNPRPTAVTPPDSQRARKPGPTAKD